MNVKSFGIEPSTSYSEKFDTHLINETYNRRHIPCQEIKHTISPHGHFMCKRDETGYSIVDWVKKEFSKFLETWQIMYHFETVYV